ncbi:MAG: hypothetical protein JW953_13595 [Anaerolineae bacterium]|nr:hypothetical protein [Anaerolineae bacterium]
MGLLHITFGQHRVTVQSESPEVLAGVERRFGQMLNSGSGREAGRLEVWPEGQLYALAGPRQPKTERGELPAILRSLEYQAVMLLVEARPDLLWLHAAAAANAGGGVLFLGPWGHGKSTLAACLYAQGWAFLADDIIPLEPRLDRLFPFPQTPGLRRGGPTISRQILRHLPKADAPLRPEGVCRQAAPVRALIFPRYQADAPARLEPCSPAKATLGLLQQCVNFAAHRGAAVRYLGRLAAQQPAFHLTFSDAQSAAALVIQAHF